MGKCLNGIRARRENVLRNNNFVVWLGASVD